MNFANRLPLRLPYDNKSRCNPIAVWADENTACFKHVENSRRGLSTRATQVLWRFAEVPSTYEVYARSRIREYIVLIVNILDRVRSTWQIVTVWQTLNQLLPSSSKTLNRCWYKVGPASQTLAKPCTNTGWTAGVCLASGFASQVNCEKAVDEHVCVLAQVRCPPCSRHDKAAITHLCVLTTQHNTRETYQQLERHHTL